MQPYGHSQLLLALYDRNNTFCPFQWATEEPVGLLSLFRRRAARERLHLDAPAIPGYVLHHDYAARRSGMAPTARKAPMIVAHIFRAIGRLS